MKTVWDIGPYAAWAGFTVLAVSSGMFIEKFDIDWWWVLLGSMAFTGISLALRAWDYRRARHTSVNRPKDTNA